MDHIDTTAFPIFITPAMAQSVSATASISSCSATTTTSSKASAAAAGLQFTTISELSNVADNSFIHVRGRIESVRQLPIHQFLLI